MSRKPTLLSEAKVVVVHYMDSYRKYVRKPVVIEAIKWESGNTLDVVEFCYKSCEYRMYLQADPLNSPMGGQWEMRITTPFGDAVAKQGDYIVLGIDGNIYPWPATLFEASRTERL